MHPNQGTTNTPVRLSNEKYVEGALYPGGRGIVKSCRYQLHDYMGKQAKDSNCGIFITFQPTDGSNEGKPTELFWNVGSSADFIPDQASNGFCISLHGKELNKSCNAIKYLIDKLKTTCGLPPGKLDEPVGLHVIDGSEVFFALQDQEDRDFKDQHQPGQAAGQQKQQKSKTYVPTYAKWPWETGAARMQVPAPAQMPGAPPAFSPAAIAAHAPTNGTAPSGISQDLANILKSIGTVDLSSNPAKSVLDYCVANNINNPARMPIVKEATALFKDAANLEVIAASNGWSVAGGILMAG